MVIISYLHFTAHICCEYNNNDRLPATVEALLSFTHYLFSTPLPRPKFNPQQLPVRTDNNNIHQITKKQMYDDLAITVK